MESCSILEDILTAYPTDRFALKICAESYFMSGEKERMRDVIGRVMPLWKKDERQYGYAHVYLNTFILLRFDSLHKILVHLHL